MPERECSKCGNLLPETGEFFHSNSPGNFTRQCKKCRNGGYLACCIQCSKSLKGLRRKSYCSLKCLAIHRLGGIGSKHGRLTVIEYAGQKEGKNAASMVKCLCDCGNYSTIEYGNIMSGGTRSCGCWRGEHLGKGENHPGWKGGRHILKNGYVSVHHPEHPNAYADGTLLEHTYVMSQFLGRGLLKTEQVHHVNGIRSDNRLENLELWTKSQPPGQRVEDMVVFCESYLKQYRADARKLATLSLQSQSQQLMFTIPEIGFLSTEALDQGELL